MCQESAPQNYRSTVARLRAFDVCPRRRTMVRACPLLNYLRRRGRRVHRPVQAFFHYVARLVACALRLVACALGGLAHASRASTPPAPRRKTLRALRARPLLHGAELVPLALEEALHGRRALPHLGRRARDLSIPRPARKPRSTARRRDAFSLSRWLPDLPAAIATSRATDAALRPGWSAKSWSATNRQCATIALKRRAGRGGRPFASLCYAPGRGTRSPPSPRGDGPKRARLYYALSVLHSRA